MEHRRHALDAKGGFGSVVFRVAGCAAVEVVPEEEVIKRGGYEDGGGSCSVREKVLAEAGRGES